MHASVGRDDAPTRSAGGGAARTLEAAQVAAVAEALERYAAVHATVGVRRASDVAADQAIRLTDCALHSAAQRADPGFPHAGAYPADELLAEMFDLATNRPWWVPAALVSLTDDHGALATSSGLAASTTVVGALLRALQELVERDAYVTTWLHQLGGREVPTPTLEAEVAALPGASVRVFDLTPAFSPHPVALVSGSAPLAGRQRPSLGLACRASWDEAVEKAYLECCQGIVFVGHLLATEPTLRTIGPAEVVDFDRHAVYYGANTNMWPELPLHRHASGAVAPADSPAARGDESEQLRELVEALGRAGIRCCYRELTTVDCNQLGLRVVRVVTPELTPLYHDHRWPHLGGRTDQVAWRYPDASIRAGGRTFPSPHPHALG